MCPSQNWATAKANLYKSILAPLRVLQHKKLLWPEFRYTINTVINMKALYPLNIVPMTDTELSKITNVITRIAKRILNLPITAPNYLIYTPTSQDGFGLKCLRQERNLLLIKQAHRLLHIQNTLGNLARARLTHLRDTLMLPSNPFDTPQLIPHNTYATHWMSRVGHALTSIKNSTLHDRNE